MTPDIAELERRLSNLLRVGTVAEADYARAMVRVACDGLTTEWLPWLTRRAAGDVDWWAPEVGEQVVLMAPSGLLEAAFVMPALYSVSHPEPEQTPDRHTVRYANGDTVVHDRVAGSWRVKCAGPVTVEAGGTVTVVAAGAVTVKAPSVTLDTPQTTCTGKLNVKGLLTYQGGMTGSGGAGGAAATIQGAVQIQSGDVTADGISLKQHTHTEQGDGAPTSPAR